MTDISRQERLRRAIEALRDKNGRVTARQVVSAAQNPKHPQYKVLHCEFIWDDAKAADVQRLERANELIRFVTVVVVDRTKTIKSVAYVRDPSKRSDEAGMIAVTSDAIDRKQATAIMLAELDRCQSAIERARNVVGALDKTHRGLAARLEKMLGDIIEARVALAA